MVDLNDALRGLTKEGRNAPASGTPVTIQNPIGVGFRLGVGIGLSQCLFVAIGWFIYLIAH
jgi:hypothetical protein